MVKIHKRPNKKGRKQKAIVARVDEKLWERIMKSAIDERSTVTDIVEDCLLKYLEEKKKRLTHNDNKLK